MRPFSIALALTLLLFTSTASAYDFYSQVTVGNQTYYRFDFMLKTIHLGDNINMEWPEPEGRKKFESTFNLRGNVDDATMFMDVYQVNNICNTLKINDVKVGSICHHSPDDWFTCSIPVPGGILKKGENTMTIETCTEDKVNYDDFQVKNVYLLIKYVELNPKIIATKVLSNYNVGPGEQVNVTVILSNVGSKAAYNITAVDYIPPKAWIVNGSRIAEFELIKEADATRYRYTIACNKIGTVNSTELGVTAFQDRDGNNYTGVIEVTDYTVEYPLPKVFLAKKVSDADLLVRDKAEVTVTIRVDGKYDAFNVTIEDYLIGSFNVTNGSQIAYYGHLPKNSTASFTYTLQALSPVELSSKAVTTYSDSEGAYHSVDSNYVQISVKESSNIKKIVDAETLLKMIAAVAVITIVLYLVYMRMS
ncbi:MAG: hypothetical protein NTU61_04085 [Candidatus Altiarchaeota archaeon]|nr:hypothetical protein [Candidatus Altiarchaeota archaeon]